MIRLIIAFLLGCLWTRFYYSRENIGEDWMRSSEWLPWAWWKKLHRVFCWCCPKKEE